MKISFTVKQFIWLLAAIIVAAFLLSSFVEAMITFAKTGSDWASALIQSIGNIMGGVIGGIVAILAAAYQLQKTFAVEQRKQAQTTATMLKLIREELRDNVTTLDSATPLDDAVFSVLKTQLSDDTWKSVLMHLNISDQLLVRLNICYRKIALLKNVSADAIDEEVISDIKSQITTCLNAVGTEITTIENSSP